MAGLFVQYLAIINSESWPIGIKESPKGVKNLAKHQINPYKIVQGF